MITKRDIDFYEEWFGCKFTKWQRVRLVLSSMSSDIFAKLYSEAYRSALDAVVSGAEFISRTRLLDAMDNEVPEDTNKENGEYWRGWCQAMAFVSRFELNGEKEDTEDGIKNIL